VAWPVLEEAAPAWGGVAGVALFAAASAVQIVSMRRRVRASTPERAGRATSRGE
jgi:hypothetical protein